MRSEGKTYTEIAEIIKAKDYTGTVDALRGFMAKEKRLEKDFKDSDGRKPTELLERKWLIQLLFKPIIAVKGLSEDQLNSVIGKYPIAGKLYGAARIFKEIMFSKKPEGLTKWMQEVEALGITELNTFCNGLKKDITAVKNAIALKYNNGLAEGSVNKIKVIKRIMYGRSNFDTLRSKVLLLESRKSTNSVKNLFDAYSALSFYENITLNRVIGLKKCSPSEWNVVFITTFCTEGELFYFYDSLKLIRIF